MKAIDLLLAPLSWLYGWVVGVRGALYDCGLLRSVELPVTVISVGNLAVGGTGKTPHVIHFARCLNESGYRVAILSRGYKRRSHGFRLVNRDATAREVGDEPLEMRLRLSDRVLIAVDRDRVAGVGRLLEIEPSLDVVLLDDGMQHRSLRRNLDILLTCYNRPYSADRLLPWGRLREGRRGAQRAQVVILTKCSAPITDIEAWRERLRLDRGQQLFYSTIKYSFPAMEPRAKVLLVCGIANPRPLISELEQRGFAVESMLFADHHDFSDADILRIWERSQTFDIVLTTAKDSARLRGRIDARVVEIDVEVEGFNITDYVRAN